MQFTNFLRVASTSFTPLFNSLQLLRFNALYFEK